MKTVVLTSPAEVVPSFMAQCLDAAIYSESQARRGSGAVRTVDFMRCLPITDEPDHMGVAELLRARRTVCDMGFHGVYLSELTKQVRARSVQTLLVLGVPWPTAGRDVSTLADTLLPYVDHIITHPGAAMKGSHPNVTCLRHFMRMDEVQECARNIFDAFAPLSRINGWDYCSCPEKSSEECGCRGTGAPYCEHHAGEQFPRNLDQFIQWMWYSRE